MKARYYDGNTPWKPFLIQFEVCAKFNKWNEDQKVAQLQSCLSGKATHVVWDTDMDDIRSYKQLAEKLRARFSSASQK